MGYIFINFNIKVLKYGWEMELIVCEIYKLYMKKGYKNVVFLNCGIFIDFVRLYLVVSLDFIVLCLCCGDGVVEFKCLMILKCEKCIYFCYCKLLVFLYCENEILLLNCSYVYFV